MAYTKELVTFCASGALFENFTVCFRTLRLGQLPTRSSSSNSSRHSKDRCRSRTSMSQEENHIPKTTTCRRGEIKSNLGWERPTENKAIWLRRCTVLFQSIVMDWFKGTHKQVRMRFSSGTHDWQQSGGTRGVMTAAIKHGSSLGSKRNRRSPASQLTGLFLRHAHHDDPCESIAILSPPGRSRPHRHHFPLSLATRQRSVHSSTTPPQVLLVPRELGR